MEQIPMEIAIEQVRAVLREAVEGSSERWSYFTDNAPDAGMFGTLSRLTAEQASG